MLRTPFLLLILFAVGHGSALAGGSELRRAIDDAQRALTQNDGAALGDALERALAEDHRRVVPKLLDMLEACHGKVDPGPYWQLINAATVSGDAKALGKLGRWLESNHRHPLARDLMFGLRNNHHPAVIDEIYAELLGARECELTSVACDRLSELSEPAAVDLLIETLEEHEGEASELERRVRFALTSLVGEDLGAVVNWKGWWAQQRDTFFAQRARGGSGTVVDELDPSRRNGLTTMSGGRVVVLTGVRQNFDQIERMLEKLGVTHEVVTKNAFAKDPEPVLRGTAAIIVNCSFFGQICQCRRCKPTTHPETRLPVCGGCDDHDLADEGLTDAAAKRLARFVDEGGSVFSEDYGLQELVQRAWPDYVRAGGSLSAQRVDYAPVPGAADDPLLRGVLARPGGALKSVVGKLQAQWKVDDLSRAIHVVDPARVRVLLASEALADDPAVAVTFSPGGPAPEPDGRRPRTGKRGSASAAPPKGIVVHVLSHFGKQQTQQDEFTLQNLLVNFLLEAQARYGLQRR